MCLQQTGTLGKGCRGQVLLYRESDLTSQIRSQPRGCDYPLRPATRKTETYNILHKNLNICSHKKVITAFPPKVFLQFVPLYAMYPR